MDNKVFVPFFLQTAAYAGKVDHAGAWKRAVEAHSLVWNTTNAEALGSLLGSNKVMAIGEGPEALEVFSLYPMHRGHSPTLRDWSKERGMDLENTEEEAPASSV